jgi:hypothetical protein
VSQGALSGVGNTLRVDLRVARFVTDSSTGKQSDNQMQKTHILCDGRAYDLVASLSYKYAAQPRHGAKHITIHMYFRWSVGVSVSVSARARARAHTHAIVAGRAFVCPHARVWQRDMTCYGADSSSGNSGDSGDSGSCPPRGIAVLLTRTQS